MDAAEQYMHHIEETKRTGIRLASIARRSDSYHFAEAVKDEYALISGFADNLPELTQQQIEKVQVIMRETIFEDIRGDRDVETVKAIYQSLCPDSCPTPQGAIRAIRQESGYWYVMPAEVAFNKRVILEALKNYEHEVVSCLPPNLVDDMKFMSQCYKANPLMTTQLPQCRLRTELKNVGNAEDYFRTMDLAHSLQERLKPKRGERKAKVTKI